MLSTDESGPDSIENVRRFRGLGVDEKKQIHLPSEVGAVKPGGERGDLGCNPAAWRRLRSPSRRSRRFGTPPAPAKDLGDLGRHPHLQKKI